MKKLSLLLTLMLFALGTTLVAQRAIEGTITDERNEPLIGATVAVPGTTTGTITDFDGKYKLSVPEGTTSLQVSYTGYETTVVELGTSNILDLAMSTDDFLLSEIIVSGQGVGIEKKRLSSTVDVITAEEISKSPATQLDQLLQSKLPSSQIRLSSGQPGTASIIRARGPVSAISNTTPVIYVDGVRMDNLNSRPSLNVGTGGANSSAIADIPVENIERIEFLKGGAATTLYGSDAANGVIQIFTKKGTAGKPRVNAEMQLGAIVGTADFLRFDKTKDLYYETGLSQTYRLGVDGGNEGLTYSFSGSINGDDGFNDINEQQRYSFRYGMSAKLTENINYTASVGYVAHNFTRDYNANTSFARFGDLEGGSFGNIDTASTERITELREQLADEGSNTNIKERVNRANISNNLTWNIHPKVVARVGFGLDMRNNITKEIATNALFIAKGSAAPGSNDRGEINISERRFLGVTGDVNLRYTEEVSDFSFITTVGGQFFKTKDEQLLYTASNVADGSESINNAAERSVEDFLSEVTNYGFYANENIGFNRALFLEFGIRVDGNSAFGKDIGLKAYPKVGLSANLSEMPFFADAVPTEIISYLKLRANYGEAGNFPRPFTRDRTLVLNSFLSQPTLTFGNPGNNILGPETTKTTEFGADIGFWNGRVKAEFTVYNATTEDAIFTPPAAPSSGQLSQAVNIGEVNNKGIELGTVFKVISKDDVSLSINASVNTVTNNVVSNGGAPEFSVGGFTFLGSFVNEGLPLGYFRGSRPVFDAEGNLSDVEANANLGSPIADVFGTIGLNFTYKSFNLYVSGDYQQGAQGVAVDDVLRYFRGVNDEGRIPENSAAESFFDLAGVWVEDTDYLKVRNIALSYDFGSIANDKIKNLTLGFNIINPINFFSSSFDPEVTGSGIASQGGFAAGGFGFGTESAPRQFIGTIRIAL